MYLHCDVGCNSEEQHPRTERQQANGEATRRKRDFSWSPFIINLPRHIGHVDFETPVDIRQEQAFFLRGRAWPEFPSQYVCGPDSRFVQRS